MKKVLIVEDDAAMAIALRDGFQYKGYSTHVARDGVAALRLATEMAFDMVILDVMLPKLSGMDVCKQLRGAGNPVPIIMLTARGQEIDKVVGLNSGADDYVTKPFSFMELLARVEAVLRRGRSLTQACDFDSYRFSDVMINFKQMTALKGGQKINLTPREFKTMKFFISHRNEVVTRDQLLDAVWGCESMPLSRAVDMHIVKLRRKIEGDGETHTHIITVHGVGYKFLG
ncbi:MAG: response regulator transcription factor [Blastocatellia bacterium]